MPADVAELVAAMTADRREDRPELDQVLATLSPHATAPPLAPPDDELTTPLPPGPGRRQRLVAAAAVLVILIAAGGALAWRLQPEGDPLTVYTPVNGGFTLDLDDQWTEVDNDPDPPGVLLSGVNIGREVVFTVAASGAGTVADAVTVTSSAVQDGRLGPDSEIAVSQALADDRAKLVFRAGEYDYVTYFAAARSCGTLTLQFVGPRNLSDDTLSYLDEVAARFELSDEITVRRPDSGLAPGLVWFEGGGTRLAAPTRFNRGQLGTSCLQVYDNTPGRNMSITVTYAPAISAAEKAAADDAALTATANELVDDSPTPDGTLRRHYRSAEQRTEARYYYVAAPTGVFVVTALEMAGEPWDQTWLDELDQIAASFEVPEAA